MILVDARPLQNTPLTGVGLVTKELVERIRKPQLTLFTSGTRKPNLGNYPHIHTHIPNKLLSAATLLTQNPTLEQLVRKQNTEVIDAIFLPNPSIIALEKRTPLILTIHDLSFLHIKETFAQKNRWWHAAIHIKKLTSRAQSIIAVSHTTAHDLQETLNVPSEKITVIYPGVTKPTATLHLPQIPKRYVLILSSFEPRKNLEILLPPLQTILAQQKFADLEVIAMGTLGFQGKKILKTFQKTLPPQKFHYLGYVTEEIKRALIANAYITLYPSRFEGFGLPPLESGIQKVPCIVSRIPSLQEILGDTVLYADPYRSDEWYTAITTLLNNETLHRELSEKIEHHAQKFSWDHTIPQYERLLQSYEHRH